MAADEAALATSSSSGSAHVRQSVLIQKAKLYEKLRKGDMSGLTAGQRATLNVDFEAKNMQDWDKDESLTIPRNAAYESGSEEYSESEEEGPQPASKVNLPAFVHSHWLTLSIGRRPGRDHG